MYNPVDNNRDLIEMLKQIDAKLLIQRARQDFYVSGLGRKVYDFLWSPVIERECREFLFLSVTVFDGEIISDQHTVDPFLSSAPIDRLKDGRYKSTVDTMFGYTAKVILFC